MGLWQDRRASLLLVLAATLLLLGPSMLSVAAASNSAGSLQGNPATTVSSSDGGASGAGASAAGSRDAGGSNSGSSRQQQAADAAQSAIAQFWAQVEGAYDLRGLPAALLRNSGIAAGEGKAPSGPGSAADGPAFGHAPDGPIQAQQSGSGGDSSGSGGGGRSEPEGNAGPTCDARGSCPARPQPTPAERLLRRVMGAMLDTEFARPGAGTREPVAAALAGAGPGRRLKSSGDRSGGGGGGGGPGQLRRRRPRWQRRLERELQQLGPEMRGVVEDVVGSLQELSQLAAEAAGAEGGGPGSASAPQAGGAGSSGAEGGSGGGGSSGSRSDGSGSSGGAGAAGASDSYAGGAGAGGRAQRRRLQQTAATLDPSAKAGPHAFSLLFSNIFDFALQQGLYYLVPQLGDIAAVLQRYQWLTDLADGLDAPLDNIVNSNFFPLPQNDDELRAQVRRFFDDFCTEAQAAPSQTVLFEFSNPTLTVNLVPVSCPVRRNRDTGRNEIIFEECDPARLVISLTPYTYTGPYYTAAQFQAVNCRYEEIAGIDFNAALGGGTASFDLTAMVQGVDIAPRINQVNTDIRGFRGFAPNPPQPVSPTNDITFSVGTSQSGIFGGRR